MDQDTIPFADDPATAGTRSRSETAAIHALGRIGYAGTGETWIGAVRRAGQTYSDSRLRTARAQLVKAGLVVAAGKLAQKGARSKTLWRLTNTDEQQAHAGAVPTVIDVGSDYWIRDLKLVPGIVDVTPTPSSNELSVPGLSPVLYDVKYRHVNGGHESVTIVRLRERLRIGRSGWITIERRIRTDGKATK